MTDMLEHGYSSESTPRELSNEYQNDRVLMVFKNRCVLVPWTKVASAFGGLTLLMLRLFLSNASECKKKILKSS